MISINLSLLPLCRIIISYTLATITATRATNAARISTATITSGIDSLPTIRAAGSENGELTGKYYEKVCITLSEAAPVSRLPIVNIAGKYAR